MYSGNGGKLNGQVTTLQKCCLTLFNVNGNTRVTWTH